jgi:hypothetical protein
MVSTMVEWMLRTVASGLRALATGVLALLILFEEWGWEPLQRAVAKVARLPVLRRLEAAAAGLPPYAALAVFAVPSVFLLPIKLAALWLVARGHGFVALAVLVAAKLGGTAVVARLFELTKPTLMRLPWFAALHARWTGWKDPLLARVRASWVWRQAGAIRRTVRQRWSQWQAWLTGRRA